MTITPLALPDRRGFLASAGGGFGAKALHPNADQHLTSLIQYGIKT